MSESPSLESLRRTRSANDIHFARIQLPPPSRHIQPHRHRHRHSASPRYANVESWGRPPLATDDFTERPIPSRRTGSSPESSAERPQLDPNASLYARIKFFFGYGEHGDRARKSRFLFTTNLAWCFSQFVVCITMLAIAAHTRSPKHLDLTEWNACTKPLAVWGILWTIKLAFSMGLSYWAFVRERITLKRRQSTDSENTYTSPMTGNRRQNSMGLSSSAERTRPSNQRRGGVNPEPLSPPLPYTSLYNRLTVISSLATLTWFLTAHILEYTTIDTCRQSSPHLWWLIFGILCIMYFMVLEVVALGLVVFIFAPLIFLFWNILLIVIGRHPYQNPNHAVLKPEIGKLPKSVVDRIPLVIYIPPPPDADDDGAPVLVAKEKKGKPGSSPIALPPAAHLYPPDNARPNPAQRKRRFRFLRIRRKRSGGDAGQGGSTNADEDSAMETKEKTEPLAWEDRWEESEYPFVRIGGNRAVCSICLLDFEEPRRVPGIADDSNANASTSLTTMPSTEGVIAADVTAAGLSPDADIQEIQVETPTEQEESDRLKLIDAGEGPQPLRLLSCGHAFHKTCVDPWLTDVSGRCPVCQQPIKVPEPPKKKK